MQKLLDLGLTIGSDPTLTTALNWLVQIPRPLSHSLFSKKCRRDNSGHVSAPVTGSQHAWFLNQVIKSS